MVGKLVKSCTDCSSLEDTICTLDRVLAQYGKNAWQNTAFLTTEQIPYLKTRQLIYYRHMLSNLKWDQNFYCPYDLATILSRAMALMAGEFVPKPLIMPIYAISTCQCEPSVTTSTTSTSTSSTSTSTTSTSTTSSTTTTTTTLGPALWNLSNQSTNGPLLIQNVTVNGIQMQAPFPIGVNQPGGTDGHSQFSGSATVVITLSGLPVPFFGVLQCMNVEGSTGVFAGCQSYSGAGDYTFSNVIVDGSGTPVIYIFDGGTCLESPQGCAGAVPAAWFVLDSMSCSAPQTLAYVIENSSPLFTTGVQIYADQNGAAPLTGYTSIMLIDPDNGNSNVFELNPVTGVVGNDLGSCTA